MPIVNVKLIEGVFSPKQKRDMIEKVTEAVVQVEGENSAVRHLGVHRGSQPRRTGDRRQAADRVGCPRPAARRGCRLEQPGRDPSLPCSSPSFHRRQHMSTQANQTERVLNQHLTAFLEGRGVDAILSDYHDDAVFLTPQAVYRGKP